MVQASERNGTSKANINETERWASLLGGGALAVYGLTRRSWGGLTMALLAGSLIHRGVTKHCAAYQALGINTAEDNSDETGHETEGRPFGAATKSTLDAGGIHVERSVTINKSPEELYAFWRNLENLPRFMNHLEAVQVLDDKRSHWFAKAPAGATVAWDAEIVGERPNELIAWQSLEDADVCNAGHVRFEVAPGGRGTELKVDISYHPPGGTLGATIAKLFGEEPSQQIADDLRRFKQLMEAGEVATTEGQPQG